MDLLYGAGFVLMIVGVIFAFMVGAAVRDPGMDRPNTIPWRGPSPLPPPPPGAVPVVVSYQKPQREMLALPRGDR